MDNFPHCGPLIRQALSNDDPIELKRLLELKCDPNHQSSINRQEFVSHTQHTYQMVKLLLQYRADPNQRKGGWTTIAMDCSRYDDVDTLQLLIDHGADINLLSYCSWSCLDYAIRWAQMDVALLLLKHGGKRVSSVKNDFVVALQEKYRQNVMDVLNVTRLLNDLILIIIDYTDLYDWSNHKNVG